MSKVEYHLEEPTCEEMTAKLFEVTDQLEKKLEEKGSGLTEDPMGSYPPPTTIKMVCGESEIELCTFDMSLAKELKCINAMDCEMEVMEAASHEAFLRAYVAARVLVIAYQTEWRARQDLWLKENSPLGDGI